MDSKRVLLTGVSGFMGSHTTIQLLNRGYQVIGTLRDIKRADEIKRIISQHTPNINQLQIVEADLLDEKVWFELTRDVHYILHMASPFPRELPKNDDEIVLPAKNGTLNILRTASENGVKRIVITSSVTAIAYGKEKSGRYSTFDETSWTDPEKKRHDSLFPQQDHC